MTKEGVEYNLNRIELFLHYGTRLPREVKGMDNIEVLLEGYSRLMDYAGASFDQYSLILLTNPDYQEFIQQTAMFDTSFLKEDFHSDNAPTGPEIFIRGYFTFTYKGFTWYAKQISKYPEIEIKDNP